MKNSLSSALVDNVTVLSAGVDHTGFLIRSGESPLVPGTVTIRNSIFASWDYNTVLEDIPYCYKPDEDMEAAHDFMFWWKYVNNLHPELSDVDGVFDMTLENNLFAYSHMMNGGMAYAGPGSKLRGKNNIMINVIFNYQCVLQVDYWDNNFYHHENDYYGGTTWAKIDGIDCDSLSDIQSAWESVDVDYDSYDDNSLSGDPMLTDWDIARPG